MRTSSRWRASAKRSSRPSAERELEEIERRRQLYVGSRPRPEVEGRIAIVVDDGVATGATTRAALRAVRARRPKQARARDAGRAAGHARFARARSRRDDLPGDARGLRRDRIFLRRFSPDQRRRGHLDPRSPRREGAVRIEAFGVSRDFQPGGMAAAAADIVTMKTQRFEASGRCELAFPGKSRTMNIASG